MKVIKNLTQKYTELWKEYQEFLKLNNLTENDVTRISFIFSDKNLNKECLTVNPSLTYEELCMYNYSVDDDTNRILVDNDYGSIYIKLKNNHVFGFRCSNYCLKPKTFRFLNMWNCNNLTNNQMTFLQNNNFL